MARLHAPQLAARKEPVPHFHALVASATAIADRAVIADIETEGDLVGAPEDRCYDIRPLIDEREHSEATLDMVSQALAYAIARGLIVFDRGQPWLARIAAPRG